MSVTVTLTFESTDPTTGVRTRRPHAIELRAPGSITYALETTAMATTNTTRGLGACLGVAWQAGPSPHAPAARMEKVNYNVGKYGQMVIDDLVRRGCSLPEISAAGTAAYHLLLDALPSEAEVKSAADFSGAGEGSSTG